jgi:tRNA nucleotidyltransferase (CCA-adding enzyme)
LDRITPSGETKRHLARISDEIVRGISDVAQDRCADCRVEIQGSVAKGTYLEGTHDVDVFVFFPPDLPRGEMEEAILEIGKYWARTNSSDFEIAYAEHPYVAVRLEADDKVFDVDVVGAFDVQSTDDLKSAVDRTKFHTEYVVSRIDGGMERQILLTKQFMTGIGTYGSEIRTGGFSGLLCEILTMHYGGFLELLKAAKGWQWGEVIDIENLNPKPEYSSPLVVIDPTDGERNAGAAVRDDKLSLFIHASRSFLEEPSDRFFFPPQRQPLDTDQLLAMLRNRGTRLLILSFKRPQVIDDIIFPQVDRLISTLKGQLEGRSFRLSGPESRLVCEEDGEISLILELGIHTLPRIEKRLGPHLDREEDCRRFLEKHSHDHPYIEGRRLCVDAPRPHWKAEDLIFSIVEENPQDILPNYVKEGMDLGWSLKCDDDAIRGAGSEVRAVLTQHFRRAFPWE